MNLSLQDKPRSNQMADSWFLTAVISHFYSAVYLREVHTRIIGDVMVTGSVAGDSTGYSSNRFVR